MKILQVNCVYKTGSTGKIVFDIHNELQKNGIQSVVCYGRGEKHEENNVYKTSTEFGADLTHLFAKASGIMYGGAMLATNKLISVIKKEKPDIVHLHCINGYFVNIYRLINWLKKNKIKTVLTLHAEFMYTGGCGYALECEQWKSPEGCVKCANYKIDTDSWFIDGTPKMWRKMKAAFKDFNSDLIITSVSPWLNNRAAQSVILSGKNHKTVFNGIDTSVFRVYGKDDANALRQNLKIKSDKVIFHATAAFSNDPENIKGGYYLIELAKKMKDVTFVVAGTVVGDFSVPDNVILLGRLANQKDLARYYSMADVTLLTSKRETFSMIVAETLASGTPVVGFYAGAPETIAIPEYSEFVEFGNTEALKNAVEKWLSKEKSAESISSAAHSVYSREKMTEDYIKVYKELLECQI